MFRGTFLNRYNILPRNLDTSYTSALSAWEEYRYGVSFGGELNPL